MDSHDVSQMCILLIPFPYRFHGSLPSVYFLKMKKKTTKINVMLAAMVLCVCVRVPRTNTRRSKINTSIKDTNGCCFCIHVTCVVSKRVLV